MMQTQRDRRAHVRVREVRDGLLCLSMVLLASGVAVSATHAQYQPRQSDSLRQPPTPAPRSHGSGTVTLPRVPYEQRYDRNRSFLPDRPSRHVPESQRVVPAPPAAGGDPARFFDPPATSALSCESLRRLADRTGRLYWVTRYKRCIGVD